MRSSRPLEDASAEAILLAGGARAILLQLANPGVGHGVAEHSDFAARPLDRLHGTLTYLYVTQYGSPEEVRRIARQVGHAHAPVRGEGYDARDVGLQVWVAATIHDTAIRVHELVFGALSDQDAQRALDSMSTVATTLGVPRAEWPATPAAFAEYWQGAESELVVSDAARAVAHELLYLRSGALWMRALMPMVRLVTAGLLSPTLREAYALPVNARRYAHIVSITRAIYPRLPLWVRHAPKRHYLARFRRNTSGAD